MSDYTHWPDGTPRSSGNAFTSHGYEPGLPAADVVPPNRKRGPRPQLPFGDPDGVIPGMGNREPRKSRGPSHYNARA